MRTLIYKITIGLIIIIQSCSPRFAEFDSYDELWDKADINADTIDWAGFDKFYLRIEPVYFFQNDEITYTLASTNSTGLRSNRHLYIRTGEDMLNKDSQYHYANEWAEFILWMPKDTSLSDRVFFMSISGKDSRKREVKVANVFHGQFKPIALGPSPLLSSGYRLLNVDYRGKVGADKKREIKKYKKKWKNKFMLIMSGPKSELIDGQHVTYIEIAGLIDKGYKSGKNHMSVYELDKIFGENFYLIKE